MMDTEYDTKFNEDDIQLQKVNYRSRRVSTVSIGDSLELRILNPSRQSTKSVNDYPIHRHMSIKEESTVNFVSTQDLVRGYDKRIRELSEEVMKLKQARSNSIHQEPLAKVQIEKYKFKIQHLEKDNLLKTRQLEKEIEELKLQLEKQKRQSEETKHMFEIEKLKLKKEKVLLEERNKLLHERLKAKDLEHQLNLQAIQKSLEVKNAKEKTRKKKTIKRKSRK